MPPPRPASGDTIYIIYAYGSVTDSMSMLACQYSQPKRPVTLRVGWGPAPWDGEMADILEARFSTTRVTVPNLGILGQTAIA